MNKKMCDYCQYGAYNLGLLYLENDHDDDTYFDQISVGIEGQKLILNQDTDMDSNTDYIRIRFCPMCGRKLGSEN